MTDLDLMETKARTWLQEATDVESLTKAAGLLRQIDEHRKLQLELENTTTEARRVETEHKSERIRFWTATLLPTLAFLVTAGTFLLQIQQTKSGAQAQEDSQWRSALEKTAPDSNSAPIGALEMQSFFASKRYKKESRPVAATLLVGIDDRNLFDVIFFDLLDKTTKDDQQELIFLARALSSRLRDKYEVRLAAGKERPADRSFEHFLKDPEDFYDESDLNQAKALETIDADKWKLDSVSQGLIELWRNPKISPAEEDLSEIVFLNGDYSGLNFSHALLSGAGFYGTCNLTGVRYSNLESVNHCENKASEGTVLSLSKAQ